MAAFNLSALAGGDILSFAPQTSMVGALIPRTSSSVRPRRSRGRAFGGEVGSSNAGAPGEHPLPFWDRVCTRAGGISLIREVTMSAPVHREIACAIIIDTCRRFLLQQ